MQAAQSRDEFWAKVEHLKGSSEFFDKQGDAHGLIDSELQDAVEGVLVPYVGPWEDSDVWFHNQDFFGNGVRSLMFRAGDVPWSVVPSLQRCLVGEASRFCVCVDFFGFLGTDAEWIGSMGILQDQVVATPYVLKSLQVHVGVEI